MNETQNKNSKPCENGMRVLARSHAMNTAVGKLIEVYAKYTMNVLRIAVQSRGWEKAIRQFSIENS